jgi:hypothetical protein
MLASQGEPLRAAFVTPLEPEDLFALSRGIGWILAYARDSVSESDAMSCAPDLRMAEMATLLREAVDHIDKAIATVESEPEVASAAARQAIRAERRLKHTYYQGMAQLLQVEDRQERISAASCTAAAPASVRW